MEAELPKYQTHADTAANLLIHFVDLYKELGGLEGSTLLTQMYGMISATDEAIEGVQQMLTSTQKIPSMTANLIRARRQAAKTIQNTIDSLEDVKMSFQIALLDLE